MSYVVDLLPPRHVAPPAMFGVQANECVSSLSRFTIVLAWVEGQARQEGNYGLEIGDGMKRFTEKKIARVPTNGQGSVSFAVVANRLRERRRATYGLMVSAGSGVRRKTVETVGEVARSFAFTRLKPGANESGGKGEDKTVETVGWDCETRGETQE